jgi:hypothetical protein
MKKLSRHTDLIAGIGIQMEEMSRLVWPIWVVKLAISADILYFPYLRLLSATKILTPSHRTLRHTS